MEVDSVICVFPTGFDTCCSIPRKLLTAVQESTCHPHCRAFYYGLSPAGEANSGSRDNKKAPGRAGASVLVRRSAYFGGGVVLVSLDPEVLVSLFLLFLLWCFPDFFLLDLVDVPVSLEPVVPLDVVDPLDPLDELPPWAKADSEKVSAIANTNVSSFFIPCLSLKQSSSL